MNEKFFNLTSHLLPNYEIVMKTTRATLGNGWKIGLPVLIAPFSFEVGDSFEMVVV
jgi:hypothetical protein